MAAIGGENLKIGLYLQALGDAGLNDAIGQNPMGLGLFVL